MFPFSTCFLLFFSWWRRLSKIPSIATFVFGVGFYTHLAIYIYCCSTQPSSTCTRVLNTDMANPSRLLTYYITILLSLLFLRANAAPISFADVEESWKRGLSEVYYHLTNPPPPISNLILPYTHQPNIQILNILHRNSKPSTHPHQQNIQHPLGSL